MNDSYDNYDIFSNKSYSDQKSLFLNLVTLNELNMKNPFTTHNFLSHLDSNPLYSKPFEKASEKQSNSSSTKNNLEEIFRCFICFGRVKNAQMCPHCSKLCCGSCIKKWLTEQKPQCPHCRASLRVSQLVNCRFVGEITSALDHLQIRKDEEDELCKNHKNKLHYFCKTCAVAICADCAMLGFSHKGHEFEHINKIYEDHVDKISKESIGLKNRLKALNEELSSVQTSISSIKKAKEEKSAEISLILEQMNQKLDSELQTKLVVLISQKNSIADEIEFLENMKNELDRQINESPKNIFIAKSGDLVQMLKEINEKPGTKFENPGTGLSFKSEVIPEYDNGSFILCPYSKLKKSSDIIYSDMIQKNGLTWRLKIYPNGNGVAKNSYLSIFLELVKGLQQSAKYEYRIEMINWKNPENVVIREFASDFETGECWGYNRFFKIEFLEKDGYLNPEDDSIYIKYYVRPQTYYQKCYDLENYIKVLESERNQYLQKNQQNDLIITTQKKIEINSNKQKQSKDSNQIKINDFATQIHYNTIESIKKEHKEKEKSSDEKSESSSMEEKEIDYESKDHSEEYKEFHPLNYSFEENELKSSFSKNYQGDENENEEDDNQNEENNEEINNPEKGEIINEENKENNCIFETGNLVKDSIFLLNDNIDEENFISLDSICEKPEENIENITNSTKNLCEETTSHIRNLLPNFEIEAMKKKGKVKENNKKEEVLEEKNIENRKKQINSIVLSENLMKKLENIKLITQKVQNKKLIEQKENTQEIKTEDGSLKTC